MPAPAGNKHASKLSQRTAHIDVRLTDHEKDAWRAAAAANGKTLSAFVIAAVTAFLAKAGEK